jgi:hypothetical protein
VLVVITTFKFWKESSQKGKVKNKEEVILGFTKFEVGNLKSETGHIT